MLVFKYFTISSLIMGCPPDPAEVDIWRSRERIGDLNRKYDDLIHQNNRLLQLLADTGRKNDFPSMSEKHVEVFSTEITRVPHEGDMYADVSEITGKESNCRTKVKELETLLCDVRCRLLPSLQNYSGSIQARIEEEKKIHLDHRYEDYDVWMSWLEKKHELYFFLTEGKGSSDVKAEEKREYEILLKKITEEQKRMRNMKIEDYLYNRSLFGTNPEEFMPVL